MAVWNPVPVFFEAKKSPSGSLQRLCVAFVDHSPGVVAFPSDVVCSGCYCCTRSFRYVSCEYCSMTFASRRFN